MQKTVQIHFPNGTRAIAVYPHSAQALGDLLQALELLPPRPVIVIVGGASYLQPEDKERLRSLFTDVIAPIAESCHAYVIDGGTDAGVMQMMGYARQKTGATFPLIGVSPVGLCVLPEQAETLPDAAPMEPHHTHFVLVPGDQWGAESPWIANLATAIAQDAPSVTVLINGGEITWQDAAQSVRTQRPIVAIAGSGRAADALVAALQGRDSDARAEAIVESGLLQAVDLQHPEKLATTLQAMLSQPL